MVSISNRRLAAIAASLLLTTLIKAPTAGAQATKAVTGAQPAAAGAAPSEAPAVQPSLVLSEAIKEYKAHPDQASWDRVQKELRDYLATAGAHMPWQILIQTNPLLNELGLKVLDASGARLFYFPKVADCRSVLLQSQGASAAHAAASRTAKAVKAPAPAPSGRLQWIPLPLNVLLKEAKIVHGTVTDPKGKATVAAGPRYLVLIGTDRSTQSVWLQGYKAQESGWSETSDVMSGIPPFLLQNLAGRASFSGNDIVLNVSSADGKPTASSGYKIVLRLLAGRYTVEGKPLDDGPYGIALQFVQALQQGRMDLAKAWLVDPRLITIPRYIGLSGHSEKPLKVIAMANPISGGGNRFRVMTYEKDDLILDLAKVKVVDLGKVKQQWAIKGVFIAPPDPLAQKLSGSIPQPAEPKTPATVNK